MASYRGEPVRRPPIPFRLPASLYRRGLELRDPAATRERGAARPGWTLVLAASGLHHALDVVVVSTRCPPCMPQLHAGLADLEWTINAYNLVFACFNADRGGTRRPDSVAGALHARLTVFVLASAAAANVDHHRGLIVARSVQGLGCRRRVAG